MDFNLVNLKITVRTANPALLSLRLLGQGSGLATACRNVACSRPTAACGHCPEHDGCAWYVLFGQVLSADPAALRRHQKPPLPFAFSFPLLDEADSSAQTFECGLVVVGRAIAYLELLLEGFSALLEDDHSVETGEIIRVDSLDYQDERRLLGNGTHFAHPENMAVLSAAGLLESRPWGCSRLTLRLHTPLRLTVEGRYSTSFEFSRFVRTLMRRISSLAYYYGGCELDSDFSDLSRQAVAIASDDACFSYGIPPGMGKKLAGILGNGDFSGDFSGLMPFLVLGTFVHAGKGASYGMGRYTISPV